MRNRVIRTRSAEPEMGIERAIEITKAMAESIKTGRPISAALFTPADLVKALEALAEYAGAMHQKAGQA